MSNDDARRQAIASRLQAQARAQATRGTPVRGVGSGLPRNQAAVGAADPNEAARLAAQPEDVARAEAELQADEQAELQEQLAMIREALDSGEVTAAQLGGFDPDSRSAVAAVRRASEKLEQLRSEQVDRDMMIDEASADEEPEVDPIYYDALRDKDRRKAVEAALEPLELEQLAFQGYVEQRVPITQGIEAVFRSTTTRQSMWLEKVLAEQPNSSQQVVSHWFGMAQVAISLVSLNGSPVGPDFSGVTDEEIFRSRLEAGIEALMDMSSFLTDDLLVHHTWFSARVRKLLISGSLTRRLGKS